MFFHVAHRMTKLAGVIACGCLLAVAAAVAAPKGTTNFKLPKGATVQMLDNGRFHISNGGLNEDGNYTCACTGINTKGSCSFSRGSTTIICGLGGDSCTGTCKLTTTTGGGGFMATPQ